MAIFYFHFEFPPISVSPHVWQDIFLGFVDSLRAEKSALFFFAFASPHINVTKELVKKSPAS
jgi:hypothetical protein